MTSLQKGVRKILGFNLNSENVLEAVELLLFELDKDVQTVLEVNIFKLDDKTLSKDGRIKLFKNLCILQSYIEY